MKKIIIRASNIASVCRVIIDGEEQRYIYLNENEIVQAEPMVVNAIRYEDLPTDVAIQVKAHFDKLFAVPLEKRGEAVANSPVVTITKEVS